MTICPKCGKKTISERGDMVYLTYPEQYCDRDWCLCGYRGEWVTKSAMTHEEILTDAWKRKNND